jgi:hypothetical protein
MARKLDSFDFEGSILGRIREGARVYDSTNREIGKVERIFMGEASSSWNQSEIGAGSDVVEGDTRGDRPDDVTPSPGFLFNDLIPGPNADEEDANVTIKNRLAREGYILIETGLLSTNRVALPDQIESATEDRVVLSVEEKGLLSDDLGA